MKPILLKGPLIPLAIIKKLYSLAIKHSIIPTSLILFMPTISKQQSLSTLYPILKISFIPTSISPIKCTSSISFTCLKLSLIEVIFFASPMIDTSTLFLIIFEFTQVVITCRKVELARALQLTVVELTVYYFVCRFEKAET